MSGRVFRAEAESGAAKLFAVAVLSGQDISLTVGGGDRPHIGSVSVAVPRQSLSGSGEKSSTVSTINLTGHKDGRVGELMADRLCRLSGRVVTVSCGIHYDSADSELIAQVIRAAELLIGEIAKYTELFPGAGEQQP